MASAPTSTPNAAKRRLRWFQFSLRTLLIFVTVIGSGLGWLGWKVREAREQAVAVAAIERLGGSVQYDYEFDSQGNEARGEAIPPGPAWLHSLLGDDCFRNVCEVSFPPDHRSTVTDSDLEQFKRFAQLERLYLDGTWTTDAGLDRLQGMTQLKQLWLSHTEVTDVGLEHLKRLTQLKDLNLGRTKVTDVGLESLQGLIRLESLSLVESNVTNAGVARLQRALPNCKIEH